MRILAVVLACCGMASMIGRGRQAQYVPPTEDEIAASLPFASTEQVLVIHDAASKTEHLVMELRFDKADKGFGIIIPVPSTPSAVEKVEHSPFASLRDIYVYTPENLGFGIGRGLANINLGGRGQGAGLGAGGGSEAAPPPPPIEVLEEHPIGSFTSFTLAVHDASELATWLDAHDFAGPKALAAWAERYARMDFSFVALKYARDADAGVGGLTSETLRVSFTTAEPYFPYSEPVTSKTTKRLLSAWVIAQDASRPIARNGAAIAQPWKSGQRATASHDELALVLKDLATVIPAGDKLVVQTYRDWKTSRDGWGDVIFVPEKSIALDDTAKADRAKLVGLLDDALIPPLRPKPVVAAPSASASSVPSAASVASATPASTSSHGCNAGAGDASNAWLVVLAFFARRKRFALVAVAACAKTPPAPTAEAAAPSASSLAVIDDASVSSPTDASFDADPARMSAAFAILAGEVPDGGVPVVAGIAPIPPPPNPQGTVRVVNVAIQQGPLPVEVVQRIIRQRLNSLRFCYESALRNNPNASGDATIHVVVVPNGEVANANISYNGGDSTMQSCLTSRFHGFQFPAEPTNSVFVVRLAFRPPS